MLGGAWVPTTTPHPDTWYLQYSEEYVYTISTQNQVEIVAFVMHIFAGVGTHGPIKEHLSLSVPLRIF